MATTVLIIDDDRKLNEMLSSYLSRFGMTVFTADHPDSGLTLLRSHSPSLVILDLMLPGRDGFAVCRNIRAESQVPIIMLTARGDLPDRVAGLELGADDYLAKPFEPRELVARIQTVLRRSGQATVRPSTKELVRAEDLFVDLRRRTAMLNGESIEFTTMEFEILAFFLSNPGAVLSRDEIMDRIKGVDWEAYNRSIDVTISRLRTKLQDDPRKPRYLKTVWGTGYMFLPTVQSVPEKSKEA